jgi:hypothetical protein
VDAGAGQFFLSDLNRPKEEKGEAPLKRLKYTLSSTGPTSTSSVIGNALGPDWHEGVKVEGAMAGNKSVKVEFTCEVSRVLMPEEFLASGKSEESFREEKEDVDGNSWKVFVELTNGRVYGCDLVVSATGVVPNGDKIKVMAPAELLRLNADNAILVDDNLRTNIEDVFAAGDVCQVNFVPPTHWFQMRIWTQARQLGMHAAHCMHTSLLGDPPRPLDFSFELFTHVTKFFGRKVVLLGLFNGQKLELADYEALVRVTEGEEYVKAVMGADGRMQGAVLVGETGLEETFENLILNGMDLSSFGEGILDPDVDIEDFFD